MADDKDLLSNNYMKKFKRNKDQLGVALTGSVGSLPPLSNRASFRLQVGPAAGRTHKRENTEEGDSEDNRMPDGTTLAKKFGNENAYNKRLERLQQEIEMMNQVDKVDINEEAPKVIEFNEVEERDITIIKRIHPNTSIEVACKKNVEEFYVLSYNGWKFPLMLNFNMNVVVDVFISYTVKVKKPSLYNNSVKFLMQNVIRVDGPAAEDREEYEKMYITVIPRCSFQSTLTNKYDGKDYSKIKPRNYVPKDFKIDYKDFAKFSNQYYHNKQTLRAMSERRAHNSSSMLGGYNVSYTSRAPPGTKAKQSSREASQRLPDIRKDSKSPEVEPNSKNRQSLPKLDNPQTANSSTFLYCDNDPSAIFETQPPIEDPSIHDSNILIAKYFSEYKANRRALFSMLAEKRQAKAKERRIFQRKEQIQKIEDGVRQRILGAEIRKKVMESLMSQIYKQTQTRLQVTHIFLIKYLKVIWKEFSKKKREIELKEMWDKKPAPKTLGKFFRCFIDFNHFSWKCKNFLRIGKKVQKGLVSLHRKKKAAIEQMNQQWDVALKQMSTYGKKRKSAALSNLMNAWVIKDLSNQRRLLNFVFQFSLYEHMRKYSASGRIDFDHRFSNLKFNQEYKHLIGMRLMRARIPMFATEIPSEVKPIDLEEFHKQQEMEESDRKITDVIPKFEFLMDDLGIRLLIYKMADLEATTPMMYAFNPGLKTLQT